jgi:hypothetical protein
MTPHDEQRLRDYFPALSVIDHSTFGSVLDRAELFGHDEDGHAVPAKQRHMHYVPIKSQRVEPSHNTDDRLLRLIGEVSRRLTRVSRTAYAVLSAYYGDMGTALGTRAIYPLTATGRALLAGEGWVTLADAYAVIARAPAKLVEKMRTEAVGMLLAAKKEYDRAL